MDIIFPKYTEDFECIASKCPDTCCAGWEIVVDEKFRKIYKESNTEAARKAVDAMYTDSDGDVCLRLKNGRCPLLDENNLCTLYTQMGKDALCDVCRVFPRFEKDHGEVIFRGISLSCPEAARLILEDSTYGALTQLPQLEDKASAHVLKEYCDLTKLVSEGKLIGRIPPAEYMLDMAEFMKELEILTDRWKITCKNLINHLKAVCENPDKRKKRDAAFREASLMDETKNIEIYYLYKYLAEALDSGDADILLQRCTICSEIICELYAMELIQKGRISPLKKQQTAQLFSKEIEHGADNLDELISFALYQTL